MTPTRLTREREAEFRNNKWQDSQVHNCIKELLAEVDALRAEVARLHEKYDHQRLVKRVSELEAALNLVDYTDRSRGYPMPKEWQEVVEVAKRALANLREKEGT